MSSNIQKKAAFLSLGCKVNAYETQAMEKLFAEAGYRLVGFSEQADVYVVNTCTVTNIADRKSRQMLHRAKKTNPDGVVVAVGCYVQAPQSVLPEDAQVDLIIGNSEKSQVVARVEEFIRRKEEGAGGNGPSGDRPAEDMQEGSRVLAPAASLPLDAPGRLRRGPAPLSNEYEPLSIDTVVEKTRANIKIQDGCNQFCSYCIIPYVRGRIRSRDEADILAEIRNLAEKGYQEVVLTGIHLSSYGKDKDNTSHLLPLLREVQAIPGIRRIRLGSLEPRVITPAFADALAGLDKVCPHFHLSLQSGCDATLGRMNRHYTTAEYERACTLLREVYRAPAFTTDVIVGFPGESEEEFRQTNAYVEEIGFSRIHIFPYSKRAGTKAAVMEGQVPEPVKKERAARLAETEKRLALAYVRQFAGQEEEVLFEEEVLLGGKAYFAGHTTRYVKVAVPAAAAHVQPGTIQAVRNLACRGAEMLYGDNTRE